MAFSSGGGAGSGMMSDINVTPMIDVMLVLMIIFMVAAPMLQTGVPVTLPKADAQAIPDDQGKLIVTITKDFEKDNTLYIDEIRQVGEAAAKQKVRPEHFEGF